MKKSRRFTKKGVIEGYKISEDVHKMEEIWIIKGQLYRIDKHGNIHIVDRK